MSIPLLIVDVERIDLAAHRADRWLVPWPDSSK